MTLGLVIIVYSLFEADLKYRSKRFIAIAFYSFCRTLSYLNSNRINVYTKHLGLLMNVMLFEFQAEIRYSVILICPLYFICGYRCFYRLWVVILFSVRLIHSVVRKDFDITPSAILSSLLLFLLWGRLWGKWCYFVSIRCSYGACYRGFIWYSFSFDIRCLMFAVFSIYAAGRSGNNPLTFGTVLQASCILILSSTNVCCAVSTIMFLYYSSLYTVLLFLIAYLYRGTLLQITLCFNPYFLIVFLQNNALWYVCYIFCGDILAFCQLRLLQVSAAYFGVF